MTVLNKGMTALQVANMYAKNDLFKKENIEYMFRNIEDTELKNMLIRVLHEMYNHVIFTGITNYEQSGGKHIYAGDGLYCLRAILDVISYHIEDVLEYVSKADSSVKHIPNIIAGQLMLLKEAIRETTETSFVIPDKRMLNKRLTHIIDPVQATWMNILCIRSNSVIPFEKKPRRVYLFYHIYKQQTKGRYYIVEVYNTQNINRYSVFTLMDSFNHRVFLDKEVNIPMDAELRYVDTINYSKPETIPTHMLKLNTDDSMFTDIVTITDLVNEKVFDASLFKENGVYFHCELSNQE